jgi:hypothetical protein
VFGAAAFFVGIGALVGADKEMLLVFHPTK